MLGLVLIYWIGKSFHSLADTHKKSPWPWAILGVVSFYIVQIVLGVAYALVYLDDFEEPDNEMALNFGGVIIAGFFTWGFYHLLKSRWSKVKGNLNPTMLDDDFLT